MPVYTIPTIQTHYTVQYFNSALQKYEMYYTNETRITQKITGPNRVLKYYKRLQNNKVEVRYQNFLSAL